MTRETAERASQILREIEYLNGLYDDFFKADLVAIKASYDGEWKMDIECQKGGKNNELVKFIIDGIDQKMRSLQDELKSL